MNEYKFEDLYIGKEEYFSVTVTEEMMKMINLLIKLVLGLVKEQMNK